MKIPGDSLESPHQLSYFVPPPQGEEWVLYETTNPMLRSNQITAPEQAANMERLSMGRENKKIFLCSLYLSVRVER